MAKQDIHAAFPTAAAIATRDFCDAFIKHRSVTAAETVDLSGAGRIALEGSPTAPNDVLWYPDGARNVQIQCFGVKTGGSADDLTANITVVGWPKRCRAVPAGRSPKGVQLLSAAITFGASITPGFNPIDAATETGVTFYEMDICAITNGGNDADSSTKLFACGTGGDRQGRIQLDPQGYQAIYVYVDTFGATLSRVDVGLRQVG